MERNYVSGVTSTQLIVSHAIGRILLSAPYAVLVILTPIIFFKIPLIGSLLSAASVVLFQNICGMACGKLNFELQKLFYSLVHQIVIYSLSGVLVAATSESVLMSMVSTSGAFMICLFTR